MSKNIKLCLFSFSPTFFIILSSAALAQDLPTGRAISLDEILLISEDIGGFLYMVGSILAGIVIILSGLTYLTAGSDSSKVKSAKDMLKAGMIGALIIFGFGLIVNTISSIASDPFKFFQ